MLSMLLCSVAAQAQLGKKINLGKAASAVSQGVQSFTVSDAEIIEYTKEYIAWSDANNPLCKTTDKDAGKRAVAERLAKIVANVPADLVKSYNLDIQAYYVSDVNAFACANGSIRVFAGLMELMTDDQILAVIGHETGHVVNNDSKDAFVRALRVSALKDAVGAASGTAAKLTDSQLGELGAALANSQYSQKQEFQADAYGFDFMKKVGKDPSAMASSLNVLLDLSGNASQSTTAKWFSSHPDMQKRIAALNKKS